MYSEELTELVEEIIEIRDIAEIIDSPPWFDDFSDDEIIEIIS